MSVQTVPDLELVRAVPRAVELRATDDDATEDLGTLHGHFSVFDDWYEVHSWWEGDFLERIAPGAFKKTIKERRDQVKVLYDHGYDFHIGNKVLGPIGDLREDATGPYYEVPLLDTSYNRDLAPGLRAGVYGASFRFRIIREEWNDEPGKADHNPDGIPERTVKEVRLYEFGPVTFPASPTATANLRCMSLTDRHYERLRSRWPDKIQHLADQVRSTRTPDAGAAPPGTPADGAAPHHTEAPPIGHPSAIRTREQRVAALIMRGIR